MSCIRKSVPKRRAEPSSAARSVRIIGGKYRGRKLEFPDRQGLRPTLGRTRETLFNWLLPVLPGARCLDLFAGSGALGLEALSRGAAHVTFVEQDRPAAAALGRTLAQFEVPAEQWHLSVTDAGTLRPPEPGPYDLIFIDPPFGDDALTPWLARLAGAGWLSAEGMIYFELGRGTAFDPAPFALHRHKTAGAYQYGLLASTRQER